MAAVAALSMATAAFQAPPAPPSAAALAATKIEHVKDNLYVITGSSPTPRETFSGGNTGVFVTDRGVVVVDTKLANWGPALLERIRTVTDKPVVTVINTHTHGDHTGSNEFFGAAIDSVVHENTKANMARMDAFKGDKAQFLPKRTYKDRSRSGPVRIRSTSTTSAPGTPTATPSSSTRRCAPCRPATCSRGRTRRSSTAATAAAARPGPRRIKTLLGAVKNVDTVIGGHQPLAGWKDLAVFQQFLADLYAADHGGAQGRQDRGAGGGRHGVDQQVPGLRLDAAAGGGAGDLRRAQRKVARGDANAVARVALRRRGAGRGARHRAIGRAPLRRA